MVDAPFMFAVRMIYDQSDRNFQMDTNQKYHTEISDDSGDWVPFGGPTITVEANDGKRTVLVAFGLEKFIETLSTAVSNFAKLDIVYASSAETAAEKLHDRNMFIMQASSKYPSMMLEMSRTFRRLSEEMEEASTKLSNMRKL